MVRSARGADRGVGHEPARDLVQRVAGALRAGDRAGAWPSSAPSASASAARSRSSGRRRRMVLVVADPHFGNDAVDMPMEVLLGKPPKMSATCRVAGEAPAAVRHYRHRPEAEACRRVLRMPSVASKSFLITIGDRSVGGLTARDQMVGPWQVPVADVAVTCDELTRDIAAKPSRWASARRSPASAARRRPHGDRRGDHQSRRGRRAAASIASSSPPTGWPRPATRARTRNCSRR
jgi:hypothetical protein